MHVICTWGNLDIAPQSVQDRAVRLRTIGAFEIMRVGYLAAGVLEEHTVFRGVAAKSRTVELSLSSLE